MRNFYISKMQHYGGLSQSPLEIEIQHGFPIHHIDLSPKIRVLRTIIPSMCTSTTWLPGCRYFGEITLPSIRSDSYLTTLIMGVSLLPLPGLSKLFYLIIFLYMGTSLMAWRRGILTHKFFNSPRSSNSYGEC